ncbi:MAG: XRE family transcriptional regulator [Victivallaceae bacterium]|jgi:Zn-dependent peptidase ImmA (M78 family)/DNA-binding XRE family transcriptional regulator
MLFNSEMLKLAREANGFSQKELAKKIGMQQAILSKYEQGIQMPQESTLEDIAEKLEFPVEFFQQEGDHFASGLVFQRARTSLSAKKRNKIEANVRLRVLEANRLIGKIIWEFPDFSGKALSLEEKAKELRKLWGIPNGPINDMVELLENKGIVIIKFDFNDDKLDGFFEKRDTGIICIAINSEFPNDRLRFTLAHELGHIILHDDSVPGKICEKEANAFAAEFLLPKAELVKEFDSFKEINLETLAELKKKWSASMGSLLYRAFSLDKISESKYRRLWTEMSAAGYRKREPDMGLKEEIPSTINSILKKMSKKASNNSIARKLKISETRLLEHYSVLNP